MITQEEYRIGMFRDTGMTPEEISNQLGYKLQIVNNVLTKIDGEKSKEHHFMRVDVVVQIWDSLLKRYVDSTFEMEVDFKSMPYHDGVEKIADSIRKLVEPERENLL